MKNNAWAAWAVKNSVVTICFTALAIYFRKWWIVLFASLFLSSLETKRVPCRICDGCGKTIYAGSTDIESELKRAGWIRWKNGDHWEDYCPECQKNRKVE